jgi:hypothetical protein
MCPYDVNSRGGVIFREEMDWSDEAGAREMAKRLEEYWLKRGVEIETTLSVTGTRENPIWSVRSNIQTARRAS